MAVGDIINFSGGTRIIPPDQVWQVQSATGTLASHLPIILPPLTIITSIGGLITRAVFVEEDFYRFRFESAPDDIETWFYTVPEGGADVIIDVRNYSKLSWGGVEIQPRVIDTTPLVVTHETPLTLTGRDSTVVGEIVQR